MLLLLSMPADAQVVPDSIFQFYNKAVTPKDRVEVFIKYLVKTTYEPSFTQRSNEIFDFLKKRNDYRTIDLVQLSINQFLAKTGDYVTAASSSLEIAHRFEEQHDTAGILSAYFVLAENNFYAGDYQTEHIYERKAYAIAAAQHDYPKMIDLANNLSVSYAATGAGDSAIYYGRIMLALAKQAGFKSSDMVGKYGTMAEAFIAVNLNDSALFYLRKDPSAYGIGGFISQAWTMNDFAQIFLRNKQNDSTLYYASNAAEISKQKNLRDQLLRAYDYLSRAYRATGDNDKAYTYLQLSTSIKDSLFSKQKLDKLKSVVAADQARIKAVEEEKISFRNKIRLYGLGGILLLACIIGFLLYRNNRQKQKANQVLSATLDSLKSTQSQLIQSEKMASLGELTAGIAHEIQNPLNFVNNFSEVSNELIDEMKEELSKGNYDDAKEIADDVKQNLEKINHHGKRADAIVKGMLQHSQSSSGQKEPTDINKLADEYLRLAYHGLRAKDKSFNATLKTDYDESIGNINVIPQDIGRVILNLITNAFYAVDERKKQQPENLPTGQAGYEPTVSVSTKKINDGLEIKVSDTGNGIPKNILDKIFQPFFTTKPTGRGTGLGLSLAYDIVKAHGGELKVETREDEGSSFTIVLPVPEPKKY